MRNHADSHGADSSRRDFFQTLMRGSLAGASLLELAHYRAAWARGMAPSADTQLFDIKKVAEGVYCAQARAQSQINSNSAIFVNSSDVLVVDAHSKASAAASLIAQIKKEITPKPVRYVVNSHFHWDHIQGNQAYRREGGGKIDFIASEPTKQLMADLAVKRMKASLDDAVKQIDTLRARGAKSSSSGEKAFCDEQIRQVRAYQAEMKNFSLELPTISFAKSYVIEDKAHHLQLEFLGRAHTAGDVVVFCPQKRVISTGDMIHGLLPFIADAFPRTWPKTIDAVSKLGFDQILPGHGPVQNRQPMTGMRNYIEELAEKVGAGKKAGKSIAELQKTITVASLKSLQSNGYGKYVDSNQAVFLPSFGTPAPLQEGVNTNIVEVYTNLERE